VDTVLGLLVTPTNVQTVLVEGQSGDGATLEHDEFTTRASEEVAEAVLNIAEAEGQRLNSIGVTWSDDADLEASLLLDSLAGLGLHNIVLVKLPQAAEALARSIGRVIGYERTAVCVVEPDAVMLSLVDTYDGEMETLVSNTIDSEDALIGWVTAIFDRDDWRPEGLFVVGSVGGLDAVAARLEKALSLPVFDPPEAELALAHGAALASVTSAGSQSLFADPDDLPEYGLTAYGTDPYGLDSYGAPRRTKGRSYARAMTMLVGGAVTFVVSVSLLVGPQLLPDKGIPTESREVVKTAGAPPIALPVVPPPPIAPPPVIPAADPPPAPEALDPAPEEAPVPAPEASYVPEPDAQPAYVPDPPAATAPTADVPAAMPPPPPPAMMPPQVAPVVPPEPQTPIRSWLKEKLHMGDGQ
jgi:hypothetical protein